MFIINRIIFLLNVLAVGALLLSYLAPYVNPVIFWPIAFLGLGYSVILIVNILFIIYWLLQGKLKFLVSTLALVVGLGYLPRIVKFSGTEVQDSTHVLKVASFNVKSFGFEGKNDYLDTFQKYVTRQDPDVMCFQEFWNRKMKKHSTILKELERNTGLRYARFNGVKDKRDGHGTAILSRYPIIASGELDFNPGSVNGALFADIVVKKDTFRIYSVHFQSNRLSNKEEISTNDITNQKEAVKKSKNIIKLLKYGFENRAKQVQKIREHMEKSPYPIILAGDFNDTQLSYTYNIISKNKKDAFVESGKGTGNTYVGPFPSYRIDYIFFDEAFEGYNYTSGPHFGSDHKMIETLVKYRK